ncbi:hypothetical protein [Phyllobacterium endophyticum]|uniref:hypothetical protein n=1 Tax=Phyllobacterium endophyticum TaxID=1149773 RepID=UPI0011CA69FC|nr:hypothetical protein [Phyllobacterium endophyticum]TXR49480.1 hypothetical protein FVA77_09140 [Phyllobacterium endophyticum]
MIDRVGVPHSTVQWRQGFPGDAASGQSAEQVEDTYKALGSTDLIYCAGGGIRSLCEAWRVWRLSAWMARIRAFMR